MATITMFGVAAALCGACAPSVGVEQIEVMAKAGFACTVSATSTGELTQGEICAIFDAAIGLPVGSRVEIIMPNDHRATAKVVAADRVVLAEAGAGSFDRAMSRGTWERLASELARQIADRA